MLKMKQDTVVRLPVEYQEVEYIESTGTQHIDTGYRPYKTKTEVTFQYTGLSDVSDNLLILGSLTTSNVYYPVLYSGTLSNTTYNQFRTADKRASYTNLGEYDNNKHSVIYNDENNNIYFDNVLKSTTPDLSTSSTNTIYLFSNHSSSGGVNHSSCRIFSVKLTDKSNNSIVRNFIPCYRKSDNVIGMYDLINNKFYTNSGSGVFLMGAIINSEDINLNPIMNNKKIVKIYKGSTLKYHRKTPFYKCLFPTSWTKSETSQSEYAPDYISTNDYGQWTIKSSAFASGTGNLDVHYAFDNKKNTHFQSQGLSELNSIAYIEIDSPIDICPKVFYIIVERINGFTIQGFNANNEWEDITSISGQIGDKTEKIVGIQTSKYYTKFKVNMKRYTSSKKYPHVYEFQIISGTFKK